MPLLVLFVALSLFAPSAPYLLPICSLSVPGTYTFTLSAHTADDDTTAQTIADILVSFYNDESGWSSEDVFFSGASTGVTVRTLYPLCPYISYRPCARYAASWGWDVGRGCRVAVVVAVEVIQLLVTLPSVIR